ncbi:hypothetical protein ACVW00_000056 [Marmoricola sp. URHA0025 HA25]
MTTMLKALLNRIAGSHCPGCNQRVAQLVPHFAAAHSLWREQRRARSG